MKYIFPLCLSVLFLWGCSNSNNADQNSSEVLDIVCTTGILADIATQIGGDKVSVTALMGSGIDPHLYKAKSSDLTTLSKADVILYNGLHLEAKLTESLQKFGQQTTTLAVGDALPTHLLIQLPDGSFDPHVWHSARLWSESCQIVGNLLAKKDTANAAFYKKNAVSLKNSMLALNQEIETQINSIEEGKRILVTAHDAFGYYGREYGIAVKGLQGISTTAEYGLKDVLEIVDFIEDNGIPAIFIESSVADNALKAVLEGCENRNLQVKLGGELFSDALGSAAQEADTYRKMMLKNTATFCSAIK